eukprot:52691-Eustigmatos_ZCMA.PRE.1
MVLLVDVAVVVAGGRGTHGPLTMWSRVHVAAWVGSEQTVVTNGPNHMRTGRIDDGVGYMALDYSLMMVLLVDVPWLTVAESRCGYMGRVGTNGGDRLTPPHA